jgi:hypothetical protein
MASQLGARAKAGDNSISKTWEYISVQESDLQLAPLAPSGPSVSLLTFEIPEFWNYHKENPNHLESAFWKVLELKLCVSTGPKFGGR